MPIAKAAEALGVAPYSLQRWLCDGSSSARRTRPAFPLAIRVKRRAPPLFVEDAPDGFVPIADAMRALGVSRQTVLQRVKRDQLEAVHRPPRAQKGLEIRVSSAAGLFGPTTMNAKAVC